MENKKNNFLIGALIIAISHVLVKIIGAVYKIPLDRFILTTTGMGIYSSSYTIYNWLFVVSTAGLPVAISKLVSEARAVGKEGEARKIFRVSLNLLIFVGMIAFLIMFLMAVPFAKLINAESSYLTMMVMAPSLFFVAVSSSFRGYFQGRKNMLPTALSEVIEAFCKLVFGLCFAYFAMKLTGEFYIGSAGAISGVTLGTVFSFLFLFIYYRKTQDKNEMMTTCDTSSSKEILKKLVKLAIPVTLGVSVFTLTSLIDTAMIMNQLSGIGYGEAERLSMYGYLNRAITLFNLPPTVIASIAVSVVPSIASAIAVKDTKTAHGNVISALRITVLFAMPCAMGLSALSSPILSFVYADSNYHHLLTVMGIATLFVTIVQVSNALLQAYNKPWIPVFNMMAGGAVKIIINLILVSRPEINIYGAPVGTTLCYMTVVILNIIALKRVSGVKFGFSGFIVKPAIIGAVTFVSAVLTYNLISSSLGETLSLCASIGVAAVLYLVSVLLIKALTKSEILLLPKGEVILNKLERFKLI